MQCLTIKTLTTLVTCSVTLAGCNQAALKDPNSPYAKVPVNTSLEIARPLEIPPGTTRIYIQSGKVSRAFNRYDASCSIEVTKIDRDKPQQIEPGSYRISRVQQSTEEIAEARPTLFASLDILLAEGVDQGGASFVYQGYHLWLDGPDPNVRRLTCRGGYADPASALPPSINQIRQALGNVMTLGSTAQTGA